MSKENNFRKDNLSNTNFERLANNLVATKNWGEKIDSQLYLTGIPEGANQLTDKESMNLVFGQANKAVAQVYFDGFALGKDKRQIIKENSKEAINLAGVKLTVVAYSSGFLNLMDYSEEEVDKIDRLILVNPMLGRGSLNNKYAIFGYMFPSKEEVLKKTALIFEMLARKDAIFAVLSEKDSFMNNKVIESVLKKRINPERIHSRWGGHEISQTELLSIVNWWF